MRPYAPSRDSPPAVGVLSGSVPGSVLIEENGLRFGVDMLGGQKTGWFLDQRSNRAAAARYAKGRRVLDAFCNAGGFGLACAAAGAGSVLAVDSSAEAVASVSANAARNGFGHLVEAREANAFDLLHSLERERQKFGLIVLDPPAFAKNRASVEGAKRGYKELNLRALKLLESGGRAGHLFVLALVRERTLLADARGGGRGFGAKDQNHRGEDTGPRPPHSLRLRRVEVPQVHDRGSHLAGC